MLDQLLALLQLFYFLYLLFFSLIVYIKGILCQVRIHLCFTLVIHTYIIQEVLISILIKWFLSTIICGKLLFMLPIHIFCLFEIIIHIIM